MLIRSTILLIFLFSSIVGMSQNNIDKDSVQYYFTKILNNYRQSNGLSNIKLNDKLKQFSDDHAKYMVTINRVTHGENEYSFHNRFNKNFVGYGGENCSEVLISKNIRSNFNNLNVVLDKITTQGITNELFAQYTFLTWKNSNSHNKFLLDKEVTCFYLSYEKVKNTYYLEYFAMK